MSGFIKAGPFEIPILVVDNIPDNEWGLMTAEQKPGGVMTVYWNNGRIWRGRVALPFSTLEGQVSFRLRIDRKTWLKVK